ncbi:MAG TPA: hypothetical protein VMU88_04975, partial [bacterium]|nr:hypothetical protein [bacterium]
ELNLGADYVLSPNFQLGLLLEFMGKTPADVNDYSLGNQYTWNEYAIGGAGQANLMFPLGGGTNFILHGEGGYYSLVATHVDVSGSDDGDVTLDASNAGWALAAGLEFIIGANKSWALDVELGYRSLTFTPLTQGGTYNGFPQSGTLTNSGGGNTQLDFSGPRLSATARLF